MNKTMKKMLKTAVVSANDEKSLAQGMVAILQRFASECGIEDEVAKINAAMHSGRGIESVLEESLFYLNKVVAPRNYKFAPVGNGRFQFIQKGVQA